MARRLYQVMHNSQKALTLWLAALIFFSVLEWSSIENNLTSTYFFVTLQMPLYGLVMFGAYAMMSIGYHLFVLKDCNDAHDEIRQQIDEARNFLKTKGMKFD